MATTRHTGYPMSGPLDSGLGQRIAVDPFQENLIGAIYDGGISPDDAAFIAQRHSRDYLIGPGIIVGQFVELDNTQIAPVTGREIDSTIDHLKYLVSRPNKDSSGLDAQERRRKMIIRESELDIMAKRTSLIDPDIRGVIFSDTGAVAVRGNAISIAGLIAVQALNEGREQFYLGTQGD